MKKVAFKSIRAWLTMLSPFFKHDAFEAEAEWRKFVSKDSRPMSGQQFRQGNSAPIPFVEPIPDVTTKSAECVPQAVGFIDEVVVGPTPAPELTAEALQALFAAEGHPEVIVRDSNIAFKSWWRR
jgi:hypothetical protein